MRTVIRILISIHHVMRGAAVPSSNLAVIYKLQRKYLNKFNYLTPDYGLIV